MTVSNRYSQLITLRPVSRLDGATDAVWFPLDHPYVERCWTSVVGPTGVALLRRAALLFSESSHPTIDLVDVARDLGITGSDAVRRMHRTLSRLERLGFIDRPTRDEVTVFVDAPPLPARELRRSTASLREVHMSLVCGRRLEVGIHAVDGSTR